MANILGDFSGLVPLDNQFFSGGLGLAVLGVGLGMLRRSGQAISMLARRHLLMTLEVTSKDASYPWVLQWLNAHGRRTQHLSVNTTVQRALDGSSQLTFEMVPGPGRHLVHYASRWFLVERVREHQTVAMSSGVPWEKVVLTSFGRDISVYDGLLSEARSAASQQEEGATMVYTCWGTEWRPFGHPRRKRPLESVVLDDGVKEAILDDILDWRDSASWYHDRGIPYRRGYLLHGPPGGGKTSFIMALAGHLDYGICILSLSEDGLTDDRLAQALSVVPQRCIVLLEDIDAAFGSRVAGADPQRARRSSLTFSGLLNTLDGVASSEERVLFMTTNYLERLDPALMRPGRVDVVHELGAATASQAERLFLGFYPPAEAKEGLPPQNDSSERMPTIPEVTQLATRFGEFVGSMRVPPSMAETQGYLMSHKLAPRAAAEGVAALRDTTEARSERQAWQASEARRLAALAAGEGAPRAVVTGGAGRRITAEEVDKMPFNPQPGWEESLMK